MSASGTLDAALKAIRGRRDAMRARGIELIGVVGSVARGENRPDSDVNVAGEATRHVSEETRARPPDLPWEQIVATRNIIVHGYRAIDPEIIVNIVRDHLPTLLTAVETLLPDEPDA